MADGADRIINLGPKNSIKAAVGDRMLILTPGGGGYGAAPETQPNGTVNGEGNGLLNGVAKTLDDAPRAPYARAGGSLGERAGMQASN